MRTAQFFGLLGLIGAGSCTTLAPSSGEFDDLYGTSASVVVINKNYYASPKGEVVTQEPAYRSEYDRVPAESQQVEPTDVYFSDEYVASNALRRPLSADPGYSMGYTDGYREGWNDQSWSSPFAWNSPLNQFNYNPWGWDMMGMNRWSRFGMNDFGWGGFGFSPWNMGFRSGIHLSMGFGMGFDPFWGGSAWGMSPFGWNAWNSPFGWNSWNSPWGWNSMAFYGGGWGNGWGWNQWNRPVIVTNIYNGGDRSRIADRNYGPRGSGRGTDVYNEGYGNAGNRNARVASNSTPSSVGRGSLPAGERSYAATQRSASSVGGTRANGAYTNAGTTRAAATNDYYNSYGSSSRATRPAANDAYNRSSRSGGDSFNSTRSSSYDRSSSFDRSSRSAAGSSYTRPSATPSRSYSPSSSSSSSRMGSGSSMGTTRSSSGSSYSSPSSSSSRGYSPSSSSSSMGGGSRGSVGGGGSSSGGSRGPR